MPDLSLTSPRNILLARKAKKHGMVNSLRTVIEAKRAKLPVSLGFALVEQETGNGANIFGHDPTIYAGAGKVTRAKYKDYKRRRGHSLMQGVGPLQLTWWSTQDAADALGGCWAPKNNLRVGFSTLAVLIRQYGYAKGIERYNGAGPAAEAYSRSVRGRQLAWHRRLA
jgi:hypothetical protein